MLIGVGIVLVLLLLGLGWLWWAGGGISRHQVQGSGIIESIPEPLEREPEAAQTLVLLSYDMAYGLGAQAWSAPPGQAATIYDRLDQIIETIAAAGADVALLREVDFASRRTHDIDQLYYIAAALGWGFAARATTWECRYLPSPVWPVQHHAGRLRAGMGIISRYPLVQNVRQPLAASGGWSWLTSRFSPHHMVHMVDVQCGAQTIRLLHVHLDTRGAAVRQPHTQELVAFVREVTTPTSVLMGFCNHAWASASPPGAAPHGLPDQIMDTLIDGLSGRLRMVTDSGASSPAPPPPWGSAHLLLGRGLRAGETRAIPLDQPISDRHPVVAHLRWAVPLTVSDARNTHERI